MFLCFTELAQLHAAQRNAEPTWTETANTEKGICEKTEIQRSQPIENARKKQKKNSDLLVNQDLEAKNRIFPSREAAETETNS